MDELRDNPEVLYGAAIALLIVVLLTPAVGGMARLLGVVDNPDERRLNRRPIPRLGGLAIFMGILVPVARVPRPLGRDARHPARRRGRLRRRRDRRLPRARAVPKLAGQVLAAAIPTAFGVWIDHFTLPFLGAVDVPPLDRRAAHDRLDRRRHEHGQLPRRHGRARLRRLRDLRRHVRRDRAVARQGRRGGPLGDRRRRLRRASSATTSSRPGSSWATPARSCSGSRSPRSRSPGC